MKRSEAIRWRKSSHSSNTSDCVELPGALNAVRDSKNGDVLSLTSRAVNGLLTVVKSRHNH